MSLADRIAEESSPPEFRCKYARALDALREAGDPDVDEFAQLVASGVLGASAAARALKAEGQPVSSDRIRVHGTGECGCT